MTTTASESPDLEDRIARLEGAYDHLATKADLADLRTELHDSLADLRIEMARMETRLLLRLGGMMVAAVAVAAAAARFIG